MMTSPDVIRPASCVIVSSVILPAGSITQTVFGAGSASTRAATDPAAVAPSLASAAPGAGLAS